MRRFTLCNYRENGPAKFTLKNTKIKGPDECFTLVMQHPFVNSNRNNSMFSYTARIPICVSVQLCVHMTVCSKMSGIWTRGIWMQLRGLTNGSADALQRVKKLWIQLPMQC